MLENIKKIIYYNQQNVFLRIVENKIISTEQTIQDKQKELNRDRVTSKKITEFKYGSNI